MPQVARSRRSRHRWQAAAFRRQFPGRDSWTGSHADVAATPAVAPSGDLTDMVAQLRASDAGSHELECLATGVYFESKSEPLAGQLAVGQVIANRAESGGRFPPSYCGVLFQRGQFSFVHGHSLPSVSHSSRQWQTAVAIAKIVDEGLKELVGRRCLVLPRALRVAVLAPEARCRDRQPHLLSLSGRGRASGRCGRARLRSAHSGDWLRSCNVLA